MKDYFDEENILNIISNGNRRFEKYRTLLNEECHAFDLQYEIARKITEECIEKIRHNSFSFVVNADDGPINIFNVSIKQNIYGTTCSGEIANINFKSRSADLTIYLSEIAVQRFSDERLFGEIFNTVAHELMHCHIFIKQSDINVKPNIVLDNYEKILNLSRRLPEGSVCCDFIYSFYLLYYHEAQAFVSQAWPSLKNLFIKHNIGKVQNKELKKYIRYIEPYQNFSKIIIVCQEILSDEFIYDTVESVLEENDIGLTLSLRKTVIAMLEKAKKILHKILNNCYYYAYKTGYIV